jgi:hypothetical protein
LPILKKILIVLGALFGLLIALAIGVAISATHFKAEQTPFVTAYVTDLSRRWDLADVYDRSTNSFLKQATSAPGQAFLHRASDLGALQSVQDMEMRNYTVGNGGAAAVFSFKGIFDNAETIVTVTVVKRSGLVRVETLHLDSLPADTLHAILFPVSQDRARVRPARVVFIPGGVACLFHCLKYPFRSSRSG